MPAAGEPGARLREVTVAEVAEALEAPVEHQLRQAVGKGVVAVFSVTVERRAVSVLLVRDDDSFVWRVAAAKPMGASEFETWLGRTTDE
jgi:hypothetical protein